jgi:hypothetical protein
VWAAVLSLYLAVPASCDEILWKDGRSEKDVVIRMENEQLVFDRQGGPEGRFTWEEIDRIAYSFPPVEGIRGADGIAIAPNRRNPKGISPRGPSRIHPG